VVFIHRINYYTDSHDQDINEIVVGKYAERSLHFLLKVMGSERSLKGVGKL